MDLVFLQIALTDMPTWRAEQQLFSHQEKGVIFSFALFIIFIHPLIHEMSLRGAVVRTTFNRGFYNSKFIYDVSNKADHFAVQHKITTTSLRAGLIS